MRLVLFAVLLVGCTPPEVAVSVHDLAAEGGLTIEAGRTFSPTEPFTIRGGVSIDTSNIDGCPTLTADARAKADGQVGVVDDLGGWGYRDDAIGHVCLSPRLTFPVTGATPTTLELDDATADLGVVVDVTEPELGLTITHARGTFVVRWAASEAPSYAEAWFDFGDGLPVSAPIEVSGNSLVVSVPAATSGAATLHVGASTIVQPDRCDFRTCEVRVKTAQAFAVTIE